MTRCPTCSADLHAAGAECPACGVGTVTGTPDTRTYAPLDHAALLLTLTRGLSTPPPPGTGFRFAPGAVLATRYRIVAPLGKGGMGEVYRADDLTLGQSVALKFLPEHVAANPVSLERFRKEVAAARQVAHPHVCRVFDIGEAGGQVFLSMEFIPGDDLAGVLRKVGRLSSGLAIDLARQVAAGLQAVHEEGLVHRDLKPANVMVDGKGRVRLTDFGLAATADSIGGADAFSGTPAYQAPEQLGGGTITERTDVYALGLLAYELLTGRRPFDATDRKHLIEQQKTTPAGPSTFDSAIPPEVDRIVLKCLAPDPKDRPASANEVWRTLPGDAALNAALAAGVTPTAEAVADAGGEGRLKRRTAVLLAVATLLCTVIVALLHKHTHLLAQTPNLSPAELRAKAAAVVAEFDPTPGPYTAYSHNLDTGFGPWQLQNDRGMNRMDGVAAGRPLELYYWYRVSDDPLFPRTNVSSHSFIEPHDPPFGLPGSSLVRVDLTGRLLSLHRVPRGERSALPTGPPAWGRLFALAGLDPTSFRPVEPTHTWTIPHDQRYAWAGMFPERPDLPLTVEAATDRGEVVAFRLVGPWTNTEADGDDIGKAARSEYYYLFHALIFALFLTIGIVLAILNVWAGRADIRGAGLLALFGGSIYLVDLTLWMAFSPTPPGAWWWMTETLMKVLYSLLWQTFTYLAVEPFVRRRWPLHLVGSTRLLAGRWRDPLVGRDVLTGSVVGAAFAVVFMTTLAIPAWVGLSPESPWIGAGLANPFTSLTSGLLHGVLPGLALTYITFLVSRVVRTGWLWVPVLVGLLMVITHFARVHQWLYSAPVFLCCIALAWLFLRRGLLAFSAAYTVAVWLVGGLLTFDFTTPYWPRPVAHLSAIVLLVGYGLVVSAGGWRRVVSGETVG